MVCKSEILYVPGTGLEVISGAVCALGVFDGVHKGHQKIISDCIASAQKIGCKSAVITFDLDPEELFYKGNPRKLMSNQDRLATLASLGADYVIVMRFDESFAKMTPKEFTSMLSLGGNAPAELLVGTDFRFGYQASGDVDTLERELASGSCEVCPKDLLCIDGSPITATRIRDLIESCDIKQANMLLGRMHYFVSEVVMGRQVGRTLGFPTANLVLPDNQIRLGEGVYLGYVLVDGQWHRSCISVGVPKTFGDLPPTVEAHIIDFDEDIYEQKVAVCFAEYLQPMEKFNSVEELSAKIASYREAATQLPACPAQPFPLVEL